jgi:hypothetical protein
MAPTGVVVDIEPGDTALVAVELEKIVTLDSMVTTSSPVRRRLAQDVADRKKLGLGYFRDSTELENRFTLSGVLREFPATTISENSGKIVPMFPSDNGGLCFANIWIDRVPADPELLGALHPYDIAAIEVYPHGLMAPAEFVIRGAGAPCGAVVVWTKMMFP